MSSSNNIVQLAIQLIILLAVGFMAYSRIVSRLAVLETKMDLLWARATGCKSEGNKE
jgi:hypothetical protein